MLDPSWLHSGAGWQNHLGCCVHREGTGIRDTTGSRDTLGCLWDVGPALSIPGRAWTAILPAGARIRLCFREQGTPGGVHTSVAFQNLDQHLDCCSLLIPFALFLHRVRAAFINDTSLHAIMRRHVSFVLLGYSQAQKLRLNYKKQKPV